MKIRKKIIKLKTEEHNVNKLILVLGVFLLTVTMLVMADANEWIVLNPNILAALKLVSIILWTYFLTSIFIKFTQKRAYNLFTESVDTEQRILLSKLYIYFVYLIATAFVLWNMGVTLENITLFVGLIATGLAFALREIILSFFVWFMLLTKRPFRIGDYIKVGEDEGKVIHIGTFYVFLTPLNTDLEQSIKIPNKIFLEKQTINYGSNSLPIFLKLPVTALSELNENVKKIASIKKNLLEVYPDYKINPKLVSEKEYVYLLFDFTVSHKENYTKIRHKLYEETYTYFRGPR